MPPFPGTNSEVRLSLRGDGIGAQRNLPHVYDTTDCATAEPPPN